MRGTKFYISDLLESKASESQRLDGADIADILIQHDWRNFRKQDSYVSENDTREQQEENIDSEACKLLDDIFDCSGVKSRPEQRVRMIEKNVTFKQAAGAPINLYQDIKEIEGFFEGKDLPDSIKTNDGTILNPKEYVNRQLQCAKAGRPDSINYIDRLKELKAFISV